MAVKIKNAYKLNVKFITCDLLCCYLEKCCRLLPFLFINYVFVFILPSTPQAQESFSVWVYIKVPDCNIFVLLILKSSGTSFSARQIFEFIRVSEPALIFVTDRKYWILHSCCNLFFSGNVTVNLMNKMYELYFIFEFPCITSL